jgi:hypothetical protein
MLPKSLFLVLGSLAIVNAAPQSSVFRRQGWSEETAFITFWEKGCGVDGSDNQSTFIVNETDGEYHSGDCAKLGQTGWQSIDVKQPKNTEAVYTIELFSGEGCNNYVIVSYTRILAVQTF